MLQRTRGRGVGDEVPGAEHRRPAGLVDRRASGAGADEAARLTPAACPGLSAGGGDGWDWEFATLSSPIH